MFFSSHFTAFVEHFIQWFMSFLTFQISEISPCRPIMPYGCLWHVYCAVMIVCSMWHVLHVPVPVTVPWRCALPLALPLMTVMTCTALSLCQWQCHCGCATECNCHWPKTTQKSWHNFMNFHAKHWTACFYFQIIIGLFLLETTLY